MKIEYIDPRELIPYEKNARTVQHSGTSSGRLAAGIGSASTSAPAIPGGYASEKEVFNAANALARSGFVNVNTWEGRSFDTATAETKNGRYGVDFNVFPGKFSIQYNGDDIIFDTAEEAAAFVKRRR